MKLKVIVYALIVGACFAFNTCFDSIKPAIDASLAVDQFQDSEFPALVMRTLTPLEDTLSLISIAFTAIIGVILFHKDAENAITRLYRAQD